MKLLVYNHYNIETKSITDGNPVLIPFLNIADNETIPADYTDKSADLSVIEATCKIGFIDYTAAKLLAQDMYDNTAGATEQDRFDALVDDDTRLKMIAFNNVDATIAITFIAIQDQVDANTATIKFMGIAALSKKENALSCSNRFNATEQWEIILLSYFSPDVAFDMKQDIRNYISDYKEDALFGIGYGDTRIGIINFFNNDGGILLSVEDYPLLSGSDYTPIKIALTTYFRK